MQLVRGPAVFDRQSVSCSHCNFSTVVSNYFRIATRSLAKQRGYAAINTLGLAIGLASALFIFLYVHDELSFDAYHPDAEHIYRMAWGGVTPTGEEFAFPGTPAGWDDYIKNTYPGVTAIGAFDAQGMPTSFRYAAKDKTVLTEDIIWAEAQLLNILSIPIVKGNREQPLKDVNTMLLSQKAARDIFGAEDPVGKSLSVSHTWSTRGQKIELMVTGVFKDLPSNTHIRPDYICNILALKPVTPNLETLLQTSMGNSQDNSDFFTQSLFVCRDPAQIPRIQEDLQKRASEIFQRFDPNAKAKPVIRKMTEAHFDQKIDWALDHKSANPKYVGVFISIAVLILLVACINYINLATARSVVRAKEIGLRKTLGGIRWQIFAQFMVESFLLVLMAMLLAVVLTALFLPVFNDMTEKSFSLRHVFSGPAMSTSAAIVVLVTLLAGSYPALYLSNFQPAVVLKGKFAFRRGSNLLRQLLTTVQFVVAVTLLVGATVVLRQLDFMRNSKLNEAGKQILSIRYGGFHGPATDAQFGRFKEMVKQDAAIEWVTLANHLPRLDFFGPIDMEMQFPEINTEKHQWFQLNGDFDFPKTFNMKLLAGRDFDHTRPADTSAVLLNQAAVKALGLSPAEAVGKTIIRPMLSMNFGPPDSTRVPVSGMVIGVVEDFPYRSMHHTIQPLAVAPKPHSIDRIIHIRLPAAQMGEKIAAIEKTWHQVFPDYGFDYWFVDEEFGRMYANETQIAQLTEKFSGLSMLIACIGLYGLAAFLSKQRTREIGIRKALGAGNRQILFLFLKVFGKILLISCAIGVPVAFLLSRRWLQSFEYQIPITAWMFVGAIAMIALITVVTVGYESLKASLANPVKALQQE